MADVKILAVLLVSMCMISMGHADSGNDKIFNGREIDPYSWPMVGWLKIGIKRVKCGVTMISRDFGVTAASCTKETITSIVFGDYSRSTYEGTEFNTTVKSIWLHAGYNGTSGANDVAVLEFTDTAFIDEGSKYYPVPVLPSVKKLPKVVRKKCRVFGWGYEVQGTSSRVADQSDVPFELLMKHKDGVCSDLDERSVCPVPVKDPTSVLCEGDVGAGYLCKSRGVWYLAGVVSDWNVGEGCVAGNRKVTTAESINDWPGIGSI